MSLNRGEINPLSVLGLRKLNFIPDHFHVISIERGFQDIRNIDHWIDYNLNSRYAIEQSVDIRDSKKISHVIKIGLEDPKEITMLTLGCKFLYNT
jgi:hypothetical protein